MSISILHDIDSISKVPSCINLFVLLFCFSTMRTQRENSNLAIGIASKKRPNRIRRNFNQNGSNIGHASTEARHLSTSSAKFATWRCPAVIKAEQMLHAISTAIHIRKKQQIRTVQCQSPDLCFLHKALGIWANLRQRYC